MGRRITTPFYSVLSRSSQESWQVNSPTKLLFLSPLWERRGGKGSLVLSRRWFRVRDFRRLRNERLTDDLQHALPIHDLVFQQFVRQHFQLVAVRFQQLTCCLVRLFDKSPHFRIDGCCCFFAVAAILCERVAEERLALVVAKIQRTDFLTHAKLRHHPMRQHS